MQSNGQIWSGKEAYLAQTTQIAHNFGGKAKSRPQLSGQQARPVQQPIKLRKSILKTAEIIKKNEARHTMMNDRKEYSRTCF